QLDLQTALDEQRRAIELKPDYAMARMWYSLVLVAFGRFKEAHAQLEQARRLDPTSLIINVNLGFALVGLKDQEGALEQFRRTLEMDPQFEPARTALALSYAMKGKYAEALAEVDRLQSGFHGERADVTRAMILAMSGKRGEAAALLAKIEKGTGRDYVPA